MHLYETFGGEPRFGIVVPSRVLNIFSTYGESVAYSVRTSEITHERSDVFS